MVKSLLLIYGMVACGLAVSSNAQSTEVRPSPQHHEDTLTDDGYYQKVYSITERVHILRQGPGFHVQVIGNVTVVEQSDGLVLVDASGTPGAGRRVVELIRSVSNKPVKVIIVTH